MSTYTNGALGGQALRPETTNAGLGARHGIVGEEQPEAEDGLGEDVKNGVGENLAVDADVARTIGDTPDTNINQSQNLWK